MSIKNFSKGSIAVYVTACLAVLFIFSLVFSPSLQNNIMNKKQIGQVGHVTVDQKDFFMAYEQIKNQLLSTNPSLNSKEGQTFIVNQTWNYVHTRYSIQAMMDKFGFVSPQSMIEKEIRNEPVFQVDGVYDAKKFKAFLKKKDITVDRLVEIKALDYMQDALLSITQDISTPIPSELEMLKKVASIQKQISVKSINVNEQKVSSPTDKEIQTYYQAHQIDFVQPNQYAFQYAIIDEKSLNFDGQLNNQALRKFYQDNLESYVKPEQVLMEVTILKSNAESNLTTTESNYVQSFMGLNVSLDKKIDNILLHNGKGFEIANQDPTWRLVNQLPADVATHDFLHKKQPVINVLDDGNIVIVQNKAYKAELVPKFEMVVSAVTNDYKKYLANEQFQSRMDELTELSYSGAIKWSDIEHVMPGLMIHTTKLVDVQGLNTSQPFKDFPKLVDWVKTHEDVKDITVKSLAPNKAVVIQQIKYVPKHLQSFDQVEDQIRKLLNSDAKLEKTQSIANNTVKNVATKKDHTSLNQSWHYFPHVTYAYNDIGYPNLIWTTTLQQKNAHSVVKIDDLALANGEIYIVKWWDSQYGPLNDVFYQQLNADWRDTLSNDAINAIVSYYPLKKFINV